MDAVLGRGMDVGLRLEAVGDEARRLGNAFFGQGTPSRASTAAVARYGVSCTPASTIEADVQTSSLSSMIVAATPTSAKSP